MLTYTYQQIIPGNAAYEPMTQKKVPKYLTPMLTSAILMANPIAQRARPARMKGDRFLMRSDHIAKMTSKIA